MDYTLIPKDGLIGIGDEFILNSQQFLDWVPEGIHAFHWHVDQNKGVIEYTDGRSNDIINELGIWSNIEESFNKAKLQAAITDLEKQQENDNSTNYNEYFIKLRDLFLDKSDWTQLNDVSLTENQKEQWRIYRQQLRDLPQNITTIDIIKSMTMDINHPSWPSQPSS